LQIHFWQRCNYYTNASIDSKSILAKNRSIISIHTITWTFGEAWKYPYVKKAAGFATANSPQANLRFATNFGVEKGEEKK